MPHTSHNYINTDNNVQNTDNNVQQLRQFASHAVSTAASRTSSSTASSTASAADSSTASTADSSTTTPVASDTASPVVQKQFGVPIVQHNTLVFNRGTNEYEVDRWFEPDFPEENALEKWVESISLDSSASSMNNSDKNNTESINSKLHADSSISEDKLARGITTRSKTRYKRQIPGEQESIDKHIHDKDKKSIRHESSIRERVEKYKNKRLKGSNNSGASINQEIRQGIESVNQSMDHKSGQSNATKMTTNQPGLYSTKYGKYFKFKGVDSAVNQKQQDSNLINQKKPEEVKITPSTPGLVTTNQTKPEEITITPSTYSLVTAEKQTEEEKHRNFVESMNYQMKLIEQDKERKIINAKYKKYKYIEKYNVIKKRMIHMQKKKEKSPAQIKILEDALNHLKEAEQQIDEQIAEIEILANLKKEVITQQYKQYASSVIAQGMSSEYGTEVPFLRINQYKEKK